MYICFFLVLAGLLDLQPELVQAAGGLVLLCRYQVRSVLLLLPVVVHLRLHLLLVRQQQPAGECAMPSVAMLCYAMLMYFIYICSPITHLTHLTLSCCSGMPTMTGRPPSPTSRPSVAGRAPTRSSSRATCPCAGWASTRTTRPAGAGKLRGVIRDLTGVPLSYEPTG
jgi:hypothetical protein